VHRLCNRYERTGLSPRCITDWSSKCMDVARHLFSPAAWSFANGCCDHATCRLFGEGEV
jgi:hypothetical protein